MPSAFNRFSGPLFGLMLIGACSQAPEPVAGEDQSAGEVEPAGALQADPALMQPVVEAALLDCLDMSGMRVHCGFSNPEDLVLLPDDRYLLVSEMGEFMADSPGKLSLLNLESGERETIAIDWQAPDSQRPGRGASDCPPPDVAAFSPHGIDLTPLDDGTLQLLVVNHGQREAVEFFDVRQKDGAWRLAWRGCALPPGDPLINDVAGRRDGGFYVTHMWDKHTDFETIGARLTAGEATGWVWEWRPESGFSKLAGSDELMPNGIAINADNSKIFVNIYMGNRTIRIDTRTGKVEGAFGVRQPDNITVDGEGNLWVASHQHDALGQNCSLVTKGPCLLPYKIVKADPETLATETVLHQEGPPMGFATVALKVGDRIYMGSAHGDRVVDVRLP
ncbi:MAG: SMP-30/gluconolactonase/LRE family protein [Halioglobus sp.]|nr:SMP-30/gluconolactonase/LRE family protein [Halioglobus sp.]